MLFIRSAKLWLLRTWIRLTYLVYINWDVRNHITNVTYYTCIKLALRSSGIIKFYHCEIHEVALIIHWVRYSRIRPLIYSVATETNFNFCTVRANHEVDDSTMNSENKGIVPTLKQVYSHSFPLRITSQKPHKIIFNQILFNSA